MCQTVYFIYIYIYILQVDIFLPDYTTPCCGTFLKGKLYFLSFVSNYCNSTSANPARRFKVGSTVSYKVCWRTERTVRPISPEIQLPFRELDKIIRRERTKHKRTAMLKGWATVIGKKLLVQQPKVNTQTHLFLGVFAKLREATFSFVLTFRSSVRMEQLRFHRKEFHEIWNSSIFRKSVTKIKNKESILSEKKYFSYYL